MKTLMIFFIIQTPSEEVKANLLGKNVVFSKETRIDTTFDVLHYFLELTPEHQTHFLQGKSTIRFKSLISVLETLKINLRNMNVDSIMRNGTPQNYTYTDTTIKIVLSPPLNLNDSTEVQIFYSGYPSGGLYFKDSLIYADNEPYDAKRWYPCFDDPSDKAFLDMSIKVPSGYKVIANGVKIDSIVSGNEVTHIFKESYPIATYLVVFAATPYFVNVKDSFVYGSYNMPVYNLVYPQDTLLAKDKFQRISWMLEFFSDTFGTYPFITEKYAHVHAPIGGAMENQTNTFINVYAGWGNDWDWVVAHELSHHWFGDWVTCKTWMDIWLNEGFASYCEALWFGERDGQQAYHTYMNGMMDYYISNEPQPPFAIYDPPVLFHFAVVYRKGASVVHMLRHVVGDSIFFSAMRTYLQNFSYSSAVTEDLRSVFESVSGQDLWWFFNEWVYLPGHPEYEFSWSYDSLGPDSFRVNLGIYQVQSHQNNVPTYKMPIDIWVISNQGDTLKTFVWDSLDTQGFQIYVNKKPMDLLFDPENWILKEIQELGVEEAVVSITKSVFKVNYLNGTVLIKYFGDRKMNSNLQIYDASGRRFLKMKLNLIPLKSFKIPLKLTPGIYFVYLKPFAKVRFYVVE